MLVLICIAVPVMLCFRGADAQETQTMTVLSLWQIDSFEGGKGSRAQYLQNKAAAFFKDEKCYVTVTSISADAARKNLSDGAVPDMISYGAGFYGIETYVNGKDFAYKSWCSGAYCLITLDKSSDFSDVTSENTVINEGKDNFTRLAALFAGVADADYEKPTGAYVKLIGGKYKYLLGTQRDVSRLITRGEEFSVKAVTQFNDLYQNISILAGDGQKYAKCLSFIDHLTTENEDISKIGMLANGRTLYDNQLHALENLEFEYTLNGFVGLAYYNDLVANISGGDINIIKKLLK